MKLLEQGQVVAAHARVSTIPESSNLRSDPRFKNIETRWAQELLRKAEAAPSIEERRALLDTVAQATTIDAFTRRKAADALASLRVEAVDVAALPSSSGSAAPESVPDAGAAEDASAADVVAEAEMQPTTSPSADVARTAHASLGPASKAAKRTLVAKTATTGTSSQRTTGTGTSTKPTSGAEPNAAELATSGSLDAQKAARDALRRKVSGGTATDREIRLLRALCRQLGDASCSR
jgi:hypothetical protein